MKRAYAISLLLLLMLGTIFVSIPSYAQAACLYNSDGLPDDDNDVDGVCNTDDLCPEQGDAGFGVAEDGCPLGPPDADGDGVEDNTDACPDQGDLGFGVGPDGCPNPPPPTDAPTAVPNTPTPIVGAEDTDNDGVVDPQDACPNQHHNGAIFNGCPDTDGDGLVDNIDLCPNEAGTTELQGCNEAVPPTPLPQPTATVPNQLPLPSDGTCWLATLAPFPVNVRAEPNLNAAIVSNLAPDQVYQALGATSDPANKWYQVLDGWVSATVVRVTPPCETLGTAETTSVTEESSSDVLDSIDRDFLQGYIDCPTVLPYLEDNTFVIQFLDTGDCDTATQLLDELTFSDPPLRDQLTPGTIDTLFGQCPEQAMDTLTFLNGLLNSDTPQFAEAMADVEATPCNQPQLDPIGIDNTPEIIQVWANAIVGFCPTFDDSDHNRVVDLLTIAINHPIFPDSFYDTNSTSNLCTGINLLNQITNVEGWYIYSAHRVFDLSVQYCQPDLATFTNLINVNALIQNGVNTDDFYSYFQELANADRASEVCADFLSVAEGFAQDLDVLALDPNAIGFANCPQIGIQLAANPPPIIHYLVVALKTRRPPCDGARAIVDGTLLARDFGLGLPPPFDNLTCGIYTDLEHESDIGKFGPRLLVAIGDVNASSDWEVQMQTVLSDDPCNAFIQRSAEELDTDKVCYWVGHTIQDNDERGSWTAQIFSTYPVGTFRGGFETLAATTYHQGGVTELSLVGYVNNAPSAGGTLQGVITSPSGEQTPVWEFSTLDNTQLAMVPNELCRNGVVPRPGDNLEVVQQGLQVDDNDLGTVQQGLEAGEQICLYSALNIGVSIPQTAVLRILWNPDGWEVGDARIFVTEVPVDLSPGINIIFLRELVDAPEGFAFGSGGGFWAFAAVQEGNTGVIGSVNVRSPGLCNEATYTQQRGQEGSPWTLIDSNGNFWNMFPGADNTATDEDNLVREILAMQQDAAEPEAQEICATGYAVFGTAMPISGVQLTIRAVPSPGEEGPSIDLASDTFDLPAGLQQVRYQLLVTRSVPWEDGVRRNILAFFSFPTLGGAEEARYVPSQSPANECTGDATIISPRTELGREWQLVTSSGGIQWVTPGNTNLPETDEDDIIRELVLAAAAQEEADRAERTICLVGSETFGIAEPTTASIVLRMNIPDSFVELDREVISLPAGISTMSIARLAVTPPDITSDEFVAILVIDLPGGRQITDSIGLTVTELTACASDIVNVLPNAVEPEVWQLLDAGGNALIRQGEDNPNTDADNQIRDVVNAGVSSEAVCLIGEHSFGSPIAIKDAMVTILATTDEDGVLPAEVASQTISLPTGFNQVSIVIVVEPPTNFILREYLASFRYATATGRAVIPIGIEELPLQACQVVTGITTNHLSMMEPQQWTLIDQNGDHDWIVQGEESDNPAVGILRDPLMPADDVAIDEELVCLKSSLTLGAISARDAIVIEVLQGTDAGLVTKSSTSFILEPGIRSVSYEVITSGLIEDDWFIQLWYPPVLVHQEQIAASSPEDCAGNENLQISNPFGEEPATWIIITQDGEGLVVQRGEDVAGINDDNLIREQLFAEQAIQEIDIDNIGENIDVPELNAEDPILVNIGGEEMVVPAGELDNADTFVPQNVIDAPPVNQNVAVPVNVPGDRNIEGDQITPITNANTLLDSDNSEVLSDLRRISAVFEVTINGDINLFRMMEGEIEPLLTSTDQERLPAVRPDGELVAFIRESAETRMRTIEIANVRRGTGTVLYSEQNADALAIALETPAWSPNGNNLYVTLQDANGVNGVYVIDITDRTAPPMLVVQDAFAPSISSAGRVIAYTRSINGFDQIFTRPLYRNRVTQITTGDDGTSCGNPTFGRDPLVLYYVCTSTDGQSVLHVFDIDGNRPVPGLVNIMNPQAGPAEGFITYDDGVLGYLATADGTALAPIINLGEGLPISHISMPLLVNVELEGLLVSNPMPAS